MFVIYNKSTTEILQARARSVGCYVSSYKTQAAAKAALTRLDKKGLLGQTIDNVKGKNGAVEYEHRFNIKSDFAIIDANEFKQNVEKTVTRRNAMTGEAFEESVNTPYSCSPASEAHWSA